MIDLFYRKEICIWLDGRTPPVFHDSGPDEFLAVSINPLQGARHVAFGLVLDNPLDYSTVQKMVNDETMALATGCRSVVCYRDREVLWLQFSLNEDNWQHVTFEGIGHKGIGVGAGNKVITYKFDDANPHAIVAGSTGSGKSELVRAILCYWAMNYKTDDLRIGLIDPNQDYEDLDGMAHLIGSRATGDSDVRSLISNFLSELDLRIRTNHRTGQRLALVMDEAQTDTVLGSGETGLNDRNVSDIAKFARQARKYRMHLLVATQDPSHTSLPGILKNLTHKFVGKLADATVSGRIAGAGVGADELLGKGDFILKVNGSIDRFQAALVSDTSFLSREVLPLPFSGDNVVVHDKLMPEVVAEYLRRTIQPDEARERFGIPPGIHHQYETFSKRLQQYA